MLHALTLLALLHAPFGPLAPVAPGDTGAPGPAPSSQGNQDTPQNPFAAPKAAPVLASDGQPAEPGRIPADTSPAARERWQELAARVAEDATPLRSFDLYFDVIVRRQGGSNDLGKVRYAFDAERSWLRSEFLKARRVQVRGPRGDWLSEDGVATSLTGRENTKSREEMDDWVAIAKNFLTIARLGSVRLVRIEAVDGPGVPLPRKDIGARAQGLTWLAVSSPDFRITRSVRGTLEPVYRAVLGYSPGAENALSIVLLSEDDQRTIVIESAQLITLDGWRDFDGQRLPQEMKVYGVDLDSQPWTFQNQPLADMWLSSDKARLNPRLGEALFLPE